MSKRFLFIGGPQDGRRIPVPYERQEIELSGVVYHRKEMESRGRTFTVFTAGPMRSFEIVDILIKGYATADMKRGAAAFGHLRQVMGHVEDGSDTTVKVYQDDATRSYWVSAGNNVNSGWSEFGGTLEEALALAAEKHGDEEL